MDPVILNHRYRLDRLAGTGGMAVVYRGYDLLLDRPVAVKVLREPYDSDPAFRARFLAEARAAARLDHPNIIHIYDVGEDQTRPYIVMELVEGEDLKALIRREGPLSIQRALALGRQLCAGVGNAHRAGIVHCDLKPQNIIVTPAGQVKVADFGIARAFNESSAPRPKESVVWGSPHYIAPEQAAGEPPTPASDVYSIGVILYELLTGVPPFHDEDATALVLKHMQEEPAPLTALNPRVPPRLDALVRKVLSKDPAARFRNADHLGAVLDEYLRQGAELTAPRAPVSAGTATPPPPTRSQPPPPPPAAPLVSAPAIVEEDTTPIAAGGSDWLLWLLWGVAAIAVLGLLPLWFSVYRAYSQAAPLLTPAAATATVTPAGPLINVPNLIGLPLDDAQRLANGSGFQVAVLGEKETADARPGTVIEQNPTFGSRAAQNSTLNVVLAAGQAFTMPSVTGYPLETVRSGLESRGLVLVVEELWSTDPAGQIIAQEPAAEAPIRAGATVTLSVSGGLDRPIPLQVNLNGLAMLEDALLPRVVFRPGDSIPITLRWRATQMADRSYTVFVHLITPDLTRLVAAGDSEPMNGVRPTTSWQPGELIVDPHQIIIAPDAPAGTYQIRVGLYSGDQRVPVTDPGRTQVVDNSIFVAEVQIQP